MESKIIKMLELQDAMNSRINPQWRQAGNQWYRAIWVECAEMLDHYGWKWWKHQEPDIEQVILEIVDIWHFMLSDLLQHESDHHLIAKRVSQQFAALSSDNQDIRLAIEKLAVKILQHQDAQIEAFVELMASVSLSLDDLYRGYVGKNVLNLFRQDHGYKEGSYQKVWNGREDNHYLVEEAAALDSASESFQQDLYAALQRHYQAHCGQN